MLTIPDTSDIVPEEMKYIQELRNRMTGAMRPEVYEDDHVFKRFLRARNYNIDQAEMMLRKNLNWRKVNNVDTIHTDVTLPEFLQYLGLNSLGYDPEGCMIRYCGIGNIDTKGLLKCLKKKIEITQYFCHIIEGYVNEMDDRSAKLGKSVDQVIFVLDFENFSLLNATHKPTVEAISLLVHMFDGNYPERLKTCFVINASFTFTLLFAIIKQFLSERTLKKIRFFGKDGWKEELGAVIDKDSVPAFLEGNLRDPDGDPMCKSWFLHGGPVPTSYFAENGPHSAIVGGQKLIVERLSKADVTLEVLYPGSILEWEFETKCRNIDFAVFYKVDAQQERQVLIPSHRTDTEEKSVSQMMRCNKPGIYILEFDNSYSWLRQKEIYYRATVTVPDHVNQSEEN